MPRRIMLSVFALAVSATAANAADLVAQSKIGAIFAEPSEAPAVAYRTREVSAGPIIPYTLLPDPLWNRGGYYYGSSWSYYYSGPYYGGDYYPAAVRLPYVCGLYGYCF
jgi:hypothetical protein